MAHALRPTFLSALLAATALAAGPAAAQQGDVTVRVDRLEKEMRAVQRKVFPGGAPVQPDITAAPPAVEPALPSSTPVSDLIARVTTLEGQIATLTGQVEQQNFKMKQLEDQIAGIKASLAPAAAPTAPAAGPSTSSSGGASAPPAANVTAPASDARKAAVAAIERPSTGSAADDSYNYGFRLWGAKFYPEAQVQLKETVEKYGGTSVGSRAQNLLGRAYLDDGKPALASVAFYENYQKRPNGDRAAQSLAYLGEALIQLKKTADACKVYGELEDVYGKSLASDLRTMMEKGRVRAKCG